MKLPSFNTKAFKGLLVSLGILVALVVAQVAVWSFVQQQATLWKGARSQDEQQQGLTTRLHSIQNAYAKEQADLAELITITPIQDETPTLVNELEKLADTNGLAITTHDIHQDPVTAGLTPLTISARLTGAATGLVSYIQTLEHVPQLVTVRQWNLSLPTSLTPAAPTHSGPVTYTLDITVVFYLQPALTPSPSPSHGL